MATTPAADPAPAREVRRRLGEGVTPSAHDAALVSLLSALGRVSKSIDARGLSRRELNGRARELARQDWVAQAVRKAVQSANAAASSAGTPVT